MLLGLMVLRRSVGGRSTRRDLELPGMVYAKVLRSTHPHARLLRVDVSKAEKLAWSGGDFNCGMISKEINSVFGSVVKDQPVVAMDRVRYVGDVIAAVAAEERDIAEEALDLIEVEYEPLPAVFDPVEAMKPYAPIVHDERTKAQSFPSKSGFRLEATGNVLSTYHVEEGDVGVGFGESDEIFEDRYSSPKIQHATPRASCGGGVLGAVRETGDLYIDADTVSDTSSIGGAVRSATIQSARHRAVCRRRLRREDPSSPWNLS